MHVLIIGNGFDIAHGFPTKYTEFLAFCQSYDKTSPVFENEALNKEFEILIENNIWLKYFLKLTNKASTTKPGINWIDFEKEIGEIIQVIENRIIKHGGLEILWCNSNTIRIDYFDNLKLSKWTKFEQFLSTFDRFEKNQIGWILSIDGVRDEIAFLEFIYQQLRLFTRAFEIYCLKINTIEVTDPITSFERGTKIKEMKQALHDYDKQLRLSNYFDYEKIRNLRENTDYEYMRLLAEVHPADFLSMGKFNCVLSFNYTNTYERLYGDSRTKYCYIHGKAQTSREHTNLILGIDDNLSDGEESNNFFCVRFKKYYQRIILRTGAEYKDWLRSAPHQPSYANYVYIVGHSLDRTDHDVLYEFFSDERFRVIVYYYL